MTTGLFCTRLGGCGDTALFRRAWTPDTLRGHREVRHICIQPVSSICLQVQSAPWVAGSCGVHSPGGTLRPDGGEGACVSKLHVGGRGWGSGSPRVHLKDKQNSLK